MDKGGNRKRWTRVAIETRKINELKQNTAVTLIETDIQSVFSLFPLSVYIFFDHRSRKEWRTSLWYPSVGKVSGGVRQA